LESHHEPTTVSSTIKPKASLFTEAKRERLAKRLGVATRNSNLDYNTSRQSQVLEYSVREQNVTVFDRSSVNKTESLRLGD
jgi:hypothetical protein